VTGILSSGKGKRKIKKGEKNFPENLKWIKHTNLVEKKKKEIWIKTRGGPTTFGKRMQIANGVKLKR
jgi:hypothetical protein